MQMIFEAFGEIELTQMCIEQCFLKRREMYQNLLWVFCNVYILILCPAPEHRTSQGGWRRKHVCFGKKRTKKKGSSFIFLPLPRDVDIDTILKALQEILMYTQD